MPKSPVKIRGVYGKPLLKKGASIEMDAAHLALAGDILLKAVQDEIKKDQAKAAGMKGGSYPKAPGSRNPVPLPNTPRFVDSFSWRIKGKSTIEIVSNWPTAELHTGKTTSKGVDSPPSRKGATPPFEMWWLVKPKVNAVPIITSSGNVIIRSAPAPGNAWIHPGFMRYSFIERGVKKGKKKFADAIAQEIAERIATEFNFFKEKP